MYVGNVFKVHKGQLAFQKLKKHLKEGTATPIYESLLRTAADLDIKDLKSEQNPDGASKKYSFQKEQADLPSEDMSAADQLEAIKFQLMQLKENKESRDNLLQRIRGEKLPQKNIVPVNIEHIEERFQAQKNS